MTGYLCNFPGCYAMSNLEKLAIFFFFFLKETFQVFHTFHTQCFKEKKINWNLYISLYNFFFFVLCPQIFPSILFFSPVFCKFKQKLMTSFSRMWHHFNGKTTAMSILAMPFMNSVMCFWFVSL